MIDLENEAIDVNGTLDEVSLGNMHIEDDCYECVRDGETCNEHLELSQSFYTSISNPNGIMTCQKCRQRLKPIVEKDGSISKFTFHCDCRPDNLYLSLG